MDKIVLEARERELVGRKVKQLRKGGRVPGVVYGHGKKVEYIDVDASAIEKVFAQAGSNKMVALKVSDRRSKNVVVYAVQSDPLRGSITHFDLYNVKMDEVLKAEVPIHFVGESTAVYKDEGILLKNLESLEVECLPADLPENFVVDISGLDDFEKSINVADIMVPDGVRLLVDQTTLVVRVEAPRSEEALAELDEKVEEELPEGAQEEEPEVLADVHEEDKDRLTMK